MLRTFEWLPDATHTAQITTDSAANQVAQIWLHGHDDVLTLDLEQVYADRLIEAMNRQPPNMAEDAFLILRHKQGSAAIVRRTDLQAVRTMHAEDFNNVRPAPHATEVWIAMQGSAHPVRLNMAEADAHTLCDLFYALELGPDQGARFDLHGQAGDVVMFQVDRLAWIRAADSFLRLGRQQVAAQDGLPEGDTD